MVCAGLVCPARGCISVWVIDPVPGWERLMVLNGEPLVRPWPWWCLAVVVLGRGGRDTLLVWTAVVHIV